MRLPPFLRRHWVSLTLLLILIVAAGLRLNGRTWDDGTTGTPTSAMSCSTAPWPTPNLPPGTTLAQLLDAPHSPLNPRTDASTGQPVGWVYGTLPVYIVKLAAWGAHADL